DRLKGDALEVVADLTRGSADEVGLKLRRSADGSKSASIAFDGKKLNVAGLDVPFVLGTSEKSLRLHVFLDHSVLEVYANARACATRIIQAAPEDKGAALFARGGKAEAKSIESWPIHSIWETAGR